MSSEDVARFTEKQKATSLQRFWKKDEIVNNVIQEKKIFENSFTDSKRTDDRFSENFCMQDVRTFNVEKPGPIGNHAKRGGMDKKKSEMKFFYNIENWNSLSTLQRRVIILMKNLLRNHSLEGHNFPQKLEIIEN